MAASRSPICRLGIVVLLVLSIVAPLATTNAAPGRGTSQPTTETTRILPIATRQEGELAPVVAAATSESVVPDQYIVVLNDEADGFSAASVAEEMTSFAAADTDSAATIEVTQTYDDALFGFSANIPTTGLDTVREDRRVAWIEPVRIYAPHQLNLAPVGVSRVGSTVNKTAAIDGVDNSLNVDVAVLDSGVGPNSLINLASSWNCTGSGGTADIAQHGTHVAGVIGARDTDSGIVGVAPGVRIHSMRVLELDGPDPDTALDGRSDSLFCGLNWLTSRRGAIPVANMSIGGVRDRIVEDNNCGLTNFDAYHTAICNVVNSGVTLVVSAGNDCANAAYYAPAGYKEVITVSAFADTNGDKTASGYETTDYDCNGTAVTVQDEQFAPFSNWGSVIDLAAPGVQVLSTIPANGSYDRWWLSGTSMAAPHVTGAAALIVAKQGRIGPAAVKAALLKNRESKAIPGDPDGINEGVVNVRDGSVSPPGNNDRSKATKVTSLPYASSVYVRGANGSSSDPNPDGLDDEYCLRNIGRTVWYTFAPTTTGTYHFLSGAVDGRVGISVFVRNGTRLSVVGCDVSTGAGSERIKTLDLTLTKGKTYDIMIGVGDIGSYIPLGGTVQIAVAKATNSPTLTLGTTHGFVGSRVAFSATGLDGYISTLDWYNGTTAIRLASYGGPNDPIIFDTFIAGSFVVPAAARGPHTVRYKDLGGVDVTAQFTVDPKTTLSVASGKRGTQTVATLTGFKGKTPVEIRFYSGTSYTVLRTVTTSTVGGVTPLITIPSNATSGAHKIVAIEKGSTFKAEATFTVATTKTSAAEVDSPATRTVTATNTASPTASVTSTSTSTSTSTATTVPEPAWSRLEEQFDADTLPSDWTTTGNVALTNAEGRGGVVVLSPRDASTNLYRSFASGQQDLYASVQFNALEPDRRGAPLLELTTTTGAPIVAVSLDSRGRIVVTDGAGKKTVKSRLRVEKGEWHGIEIHVVSSSNGAEIEVWLDGVEVPGLSTSLPGLSEAMSGIRLGTTAKARSFVLLVDDVAVDVTALGEHTVSEPTATVAPTEDTESSATPTPTATIEAEAPSEVPTTEPIGEPTDTEEPVSTATPPAELNTSPEPTEELSNEGASSNQQDETPQRRSRCANDEDGSQRETRACR